MPILALLLAAAGPVTAPPPTLQADPFYAKYVDASGVPILSSAKVPDAALAAARAIVVACSRTAPT